ncbi:unnamed protein product [Cunninghamella blakesleeana]
MPGLKSTELSLKENGFSSEYILNKERQLILDEDDGLTIKQPLGQKMDIVIPKKEIKDHSIQCKQFIDIFGTTYIPDEQPFITSNKPTTQLDHKYVHNDQVRLDVIDEFIQTETNYVKKLEAIVKKIVIPLKRSYENDRYPILGRFEFNVIYEPMEQIYELHDQFLKELNNKEKDFATTCEKYMKKLASYRSYLLKMDQVHLLNDKKFRELRMYRGFFVVNTKNSILENLTRRDILDVPWKRVTNYPMLIQRIRNHTSTDHPDFNKLTNAYTEVDITASAPDDLPTIIAKKSYEFRTMIRDAPDDIVKQNSTFVTHWDAIELNRDTGKVHKNVTLFLFRDKIMVLKRSRQAKGSELCDCFTSSPSQPLSKKKADQFKFLGKVPIEYVEITHGPSDLPNSITIRATSDFQERRDTVATSEKHFTKGARVYQIDENSNKKQSSCINDKNHFVDSFYKNQAYSKLNGNNDTTYYRNWNDINVYSNVYDYETYSKVEFKNNIVAILLEKESTIDISSLINNTSNNSSSPWIVALVRPDTHGLKLSIWSKESLVCIHEQKQYSNNDGQLDFATVFWNNVITCERKLRCSSNYRLKNETVEEQQEMERQNLRDRDRGRSRSGSRSPFRSRSLSMPKIFTRSRSQSPASSINSNSPQSSNSTPYKGSSSENQEQNNRPRSYSMNNNNNNNNNDMDQKENTTSNSGRRRKFSFDASSIFKRDMKPSSSTSTSSSSHSKQSSTSQLTSLFSSPSSIFNNNKESTHSHKHHQSMSIVTSSSTTSSSNTITPTMIHPTELPSPPYLLNQSRKQYNDSPTSITSSSDHSNSSKSTYPSSSSSSSSTIRLSKTSMEGFQLNHTSEPLVTPPPTRNGSFSSAATFLSTSSSSQHNHPSFGAMSSSSTNFNTMSSYASQSSRSSFSLEEMDPMKAQGPSPRNIADNILLNNNNNNNNNGHPHYPVNENDDLAYKVVSDMMNQQFHRHQKSLSPYYKSIMDQQQQQQHIHPPPSPSSSPQHQQRRPSISNHYQEQTLEHVNVAVDHLSNQVIPKFQFFLDKQRMLGNQLKRVNDRLPSNDYDASILNEMYHDNNEEATNVYNTLNKNLEDINNILNAYHHGQQLYRQRLNSFHEPIIPNEADTLLKNKLKETQKERDYWRRRASELNSQVNEFIYRQ